LSWRENRATQWLLPSSARAAERYLPLASPR
jgi:hypothetical protein